MSEEEEDFWTSEEGILIRLEDLSHDFTFKTYNGALLGTFRDSGFKRLVWVTTSAKPCPDCEELSGREYRAAGFLPRMPRHVKCACYWDVLMEL